MVSPAQTGVLTGSMRTLITNVTEMEKRVSDELFVYPWRPPAPEPMCIYNWLQPSPFQLIDQVKHRDVVNLVATLAFRHTDMPIEMARAMDFVDVFREVIDTELYTKTPCGAHWAQRQSMQTSSPTFGAVQYLGFDFGITFHLDRMIQPQN